MGGIFPGCQLEQSHFPRHTLAVCTSHTHSFTFHIRSGDIMAWYMEKIYNAWGEITWRGAKRVASDCHICLWCSNRGNNVKIWITISHHIISYREMYSAPNTKILNICFLTLLTWHQCFDVVGWVTGRASEWWGAGTVICLERGADLHMAQLMPLPLTVSCFSKIQIGFTFLVPAHPGSPGKMAVKRVCNMASGTTSSLQNTEWWDVGMVICL